MFKPVTIGYYKQVRNNPRCVCNVDNGLVPGLAVIVDEASGKVTLPANATAAKTKVWIVSNIIDKPEIRNKEDYKILKNEYVRADYLADAKELLIELDTSVITTYGDIGETNKYLVPTAATGKWTAVSSVSGYALYLEVIEKSSFGGQGVVAKVKVV